MHCYAVDLNFPIYFFQHCHSIGQEETLKGDRPLHENTLWNFGMSGTFSSLKDLYAYYDRNVIALSFGFNLQSWSNLKISYFIKHKDNELCMLILYERVDLSEFWRALIYFIAFHCSGNFQISC